MTNLLEVGICQLVSINNAPIKKYLDIISNNKCLNYLLVFRLSSHNVDIEYGRVNGILREHSIVKLALPT